MRASPSPNNAGAAAVRVGLISDTHGLLRPEVLPALAGVDAIIHAGDIGCASILDQLREIAPVHAVRGNNDRGMWARGLAARLDLLFGPVGIHVLHDLHDLRAGRLGASTQVVISGHSHRPQVLARDGRLWVNPGSAGPRRFRLPVTVAVLHLGASTPHARIVTLV